MTQHQFRILLIVDCVVTVIALMCAVASPYYLPPELRVYVEGPSVEELSWHDAFLLTGVLAMLILAVVTTAGLWRFRRWARAVRLWCGVVVFVSSLFFGPVVMTSLASTLVWLNAMIEGGLLALVYLSPMALWFTQTSEAARAA